MIYFQRFNSLLTKKKYIYQIMILSNIGYQTSNIDIIF